MYVAALLRHDVYKSLPRRIRERESVFDCLDSALRQNASGQNERYKIIGVDVWGEFFPNIWIY